MSGPDCAVIVLCGQSKQVRHFQYDNIITSSRLLATLSPPSRCQRKRRGAETMTSKVKLSHTVLEELPARYAHTSLPASSCRSSSPDSGTAARLRMATSSIAPVR
eukprot:2611240-Pleurochrysis_carterae.AAC.2